MSELISIVQIDQPFCKLEYGEAPCAAALGTTGEAKCHNTRSTCQDPDNYDPETLTLSFSRPQIGTDQYGNVIPSISAGIEITPMEINLGGMDPDMRPFGRREALTVRFADHQHSDHLVDKYRLERPTGDAGTVYDPYEQGSFWGKWLARNPFHEGYRVRLLQGTSDQSLAEMETRHYYIDSFRGPSDGSVTLAAKDLFSLAESRKSKAPEASRGELRNGFEEDHGGFFAVVPDGIAEVDYPSGEFWVAINDECIRVSRPSGSSVFSIIERGALGTEAEEHEPTDAVQLVLAFESMQAHDIIADLLTGYTGITAEQIPKADWDGQMADRPELLTGYIAKPTAVETLIGELAEQMGITVWPSAADDEIKLRVLAPADAPAPTVDDDAWMLEGSYSGRREIKQRVSQVWVYYGQISPLDNQGDPENYRSRRVFADLEAESADLYDSASVREIYSRWIPQFAGTFAATTGSRILSLFRDPPLRAAFDLYRSREGALDFAKPFLLSTRDEQDALGRAETKTMVPIELVRNEERIEVLAQQLRFFLPAPEERVISIETDSENVNMRSLYQALFGDPSPGDQVIVRVLDGVVISSASTDLPALATGEWGEGVILSLDLQGASQVLAAGGDGGAPGEDGAHGGNGLQADYDLFIEGAGQIGAGGGGGGGALDTTDGLLAEATGGGGAGRVPGTGHQDGTDTLGGGGGYAEDSTDGEEFVTVRADAGDGGDLGEPGRDGTTTINLDGQGLGGRAGAAIDGGGRVSIEDSVTIIGEVRVDEITELNPPAAVPQNLTLTSELVLSSTTDYAINLVFAFDDPEDIRINSFEAEYRLGRHGANWQPLYNALETRHEWSTAEVGQFQVRVRSVYPGQITSGWAYAQTVNLGTFDQLSVIGLEAPIDPLLFITTDPDSSTADIRIEADYAEGAGAMPDRFILMYSAATNPRQLVVEEDTGADRIYLDADESVAGLFTMPVDAGGSERVINYIRPQGVDINTVGGWWAAIDRQSAGFSEYRKVNQASANQLTLGRGDAYDFAPQSGDTIHIAELDWADSRLPEFKLAYINGEVMRHRGIKLDDSGATDRYYLDIGERGAEGTAQIQHSPGDRLDYYPAPGPLTNIVEIPAGEFTVIGGQFVFSGTIPVDIPPNMGWAAVTCSVARKASDDDSALYVRSHIIPLTIAGPV